MTVYCSSTYCFRESTYSFNWAISAWWVVFISLIYFSKPSINKSKSSLLFYSFFAKVGVPISFVTSLILITSSWKSVLNGLICLFTTFSKSLYFSTSIILVAGYLRSESSKFRFSSIKTYIFLSFSRLWSSIFYI